MEGVIYRIAGKSDAAELLDIYAPYVEKTAVTFEYDVPTLGNFMERMERIQRKFPFLVAEEQNHILGYAYCGAFHERAAYEWSVESTIYLKETAKGRGIGRKLYEILENISREQHLLNLNACIAVTDTEDAYLTNNSARFHSHMGFQTVGRFHNSGYKFGRWYDMIWMEKMIGDHGGNPPKVIPFPALDKGRYEEFLDC